MILLAAIGAFFSGVRVTDISRMAAAETGRPSPQLRARLREPLLWSSVLARVGIGVGIVYLMTTKPDATISVLAVGLGAVLGVLLSLPAWSRAGATEKVAPRTGAPPAGAPAIRLFLTFEAVAFVAASLTHFGVLIRGYEHQEAGLAEAVIASVLIVGLLAILLRPAWTRDVGLGAQGFALLVTLIGVFTIAVGVGPRTVPDIIYHAGIVLALVWGLVVAVRARPDDATPMESEV